MFGPCVATPRSVSAIKFAQCENSACLILPVWFGTSKGGGGGVALCEGM